MIKLKEILFENKNDKDDEEWKGIGYDSFESVNEGPDADLFKKLGKVDDMIIKLLMQYTAKADVHKIAHSWMAGLHAKIKKHGIKI